MMNSGGYSLADIAAATGGSNNRGSNDGMWGGDGAWWIIILFLFVFCGWGNNGWGGFGGNGGGINGAAGQGALTRGDLCMDMSFQDVKSGVQNIDDAVRLGFSNLNSTICNQQYDTAQMINGLGNTIQGGFNAANVVALQNQNALQSQIAQCCCDAQQTMAGINYNLSTQACDTRNTIQNSTRDIIDNQNSNSRAILDYLCQQSIEAKNEKIADLNQQLFTAQLAASQSAQNAYLINQLRPTAVPAYITCSPYASAFGYPYAGNGCGCGYQTANSGCGCC